MSLTQKKEQSPLEDRLIQQIKLITKKTFKKTDLTIVFR